MRIHPLLLASLILASSSAAQDREAIVCNGWRLEYASSTSAALLEGAITLLVSPEGDTLFAEAGAGGLFQLQAGTIGDQRVTAAPDSTEKLRLFYYDLKNADGVRLPFSSILDVHFTPDEARFTQTICNVSEIARFEEGCGVKIPLESGSRIDFSGVTGDSSTVYLTFDPKTAARFPFTSLINISSASARLTLALRNPLYPVPRLISDGMLLESMLSAPPNSYHGTNLKNIASILEPGDSVRASWAVTSRKPSPFRSETEENFVLLSPHPFSGEQSIYFAYDDIPDLINVWAAPRSSADNFAPISSNLLKLLDDFPDVRFTYLMLLDGISETSPWYWPSWWPPSNNVAPDSTDPFEGRSSCCIRLPDAAGSHVGYLYTFVEVEPGEEYRLSFQGSHSVGSGGVADVTSRVFELDNRQTVGEGRAIFTGVGGWNEQALTFRTKTARLVTIEILASGRNAEVKFDAFRCEPLSGGANAVGNSGFESFRPYYLINPDDEPLWANCHGPYRVATEATAEYKNFLVELQNGETGASHAGQIGLALHGYHHTPDSTFALFPAYPQHEFDLYRPYADSVTFANIAADIRAIGLDVDRILSFLRFPGHRHTESVIKPLIDNNCRIIDKGIIVDGRHYFGKTFRNRGNFWTTQSISWHDSPFGSMSVLKENLDRGRCALIGAHYNLFASVESDHGVAGARALLEWLEGDYPHLRWMVGDEMATLWDAVGGVEDVRQTGFGDNILLEWTGAVVRGQTAVVLMKDPDQQPRFVRFDRNIIGWEKRGSRLFIELPESPAGGHRLDVALKADSSGADPSTGRLQFHWRDENRVRLTGISAQSSKIVVSLYNLQGRLLHHREYSVRAADAVDLTLDYAGLGSGVYFVSVEDGVNRAYGALTRIR